MKMDSFNSTESINSDVQVFSTWVIYGQLFLVVGSMVWFTTVKKNYKPLPVSKLYILKMVAMVALLTLAGFGSYLSQTDGDIPWKSITLIFGTVCSIIIQEMARKTGSISVPILVVYWFLTSLYLWMFFTLFRSAETDIWSYSVMCGLSLVSSLIFILCCRGEELPEYRHDGSVECNVGMFNSFTLTWVTTEILKLYRLRQNRENGIFTLDDLKEMPIRYRIENRFDKFESQFHKQLQKDTKEMKKTEKDTLLASDVTIPKYTIYKTIMKTYNKDLLVVLFFNISFSIIRWLTPFFLTKILFVIKSVLVGEEYISNSIGLMYCIGYLISAVIIYLVEARQYYHSFILAFSIRWQLNHLLFKKTLTVNIGQQSLTSGQLTNLMSDDTGRYHRIVEEVPQSLSRIITVFGSLIYLYFIIGWAAFVIPAVFVFIMPITWFTSKKMKEMRKQIQEKNDKRLKIMNEIINGIRVLKMYAWETAFMKKVNNLRKEQMIDRRTQNNLGVILGSIYRFTPFLIKLASFAAYIIWIGPLDSVQVFSSGYIYGFLAWSLNDLTQLLPLVAELQVSNERLMKYLTSKDVPRKHITIGPSSNKTAVIISGNYSWNSETTTLSNVDIKIDQGELVAIVGPVGCGKSSFISALLGDLQTSNGKIALNGTIGYVPQQAWIQNLTIKENILFGSKYKDLFYNKVVDSCCLRTDINGFSNGDETEIGEKGINMSGGQKQRLSMARAVYSDADIYLLDDPLSALDAHVGRDMFDNVLGPNGLLKSKTRILVTHATQYLKDADKIIVMDGGGQIIASGSLQDLRNLHSERIDQIIPHKNGSNGNLNDQKNTEQNEIGTKKDNNDSDGKIIEDESSEQIEPSWQAVWKYCKIVGAKWGIVYLIFHIADVTFRTVDGIWLAKWMNATTEYSETYDNSSCGTESNVTCTCGYTNFNDNCLGDTFYLIIYGFIALAVSLVTLMRSFTHAEGSLRASIKIQETMLSSVLHAPIAFFDKTPVGRIIHRFSADIGTIDGGIPWMISETFHTIISLFSIFYVVARTNYALLLFAIPIIPVMLVMKKYFIPVSRDCVRLISNTNSPIYSNYGNVISGASVIRASKSEIRFTNIGLNQIGKTLKIEYFYNRAILWAFINLGLIGQVFVFGVSVFAVYGRNWGIPVADISFAVSYSIVISQVLFSLMMNYARLERGMVNVDRVAEYSKLESEDDWRKQTDEPQFATKGQINFENFGLRYRPDDPMIIKNLSCTINGGEKVGIVGRTGAGKSTLTSGLFRIIEAAEGKISIDDVDISTLGLHDLREKLSIIPQEPVLYSGTIRSNLDPHETCSDEELWAAIKDAHIEPYILKLENKLSHEVSENGSNLSVGERQMICLTRALLKRSKIIVLDEATSAIDHLTDSLIQKTIRNAFSESTIITIAHRINTIIDYDRILVLDKGQLAEFDTPANLFSNKDSIFRSLCDESQISLEEINLSKNLKTN